IPLGDIRLAVNHLCVKHKVRPSRLSVRAGEIVGLAGLVGAGRCELAQLIFGVHQPSGGEIWIDGVRVQIHSPRDAIARG
ncbi:ATP-binding cassette domain-containing protein, partial [Pantoea sp. GbtcB22]|uniref:ATP-binding cassette domain-containing protein n=1 Tax=Pantoea sp. GbtcB22 TaxID=2824767 RepID=UPI001C30679B